MTTFLTEYFFYFWGNFIFFSGELFWFYKAITTFFNRIYFFYFWGNFIFFLRIFFLILYITVHLFLRKNGFIYTEIFSQLYRQNWIISTFFIIFCAEKFLQKFYHFKRTKLLDYDTVIKGLKTKSIFELNRYFY